MGCYWLPLSRKCIVLLAWKLCFLLSCLKGIIISITNRCNSHSISTCTLPPTPPLCLCPSLVSDVYQVCLFCHFIYLFLVVWLFLCCEYMFLQSRPAGGDWKIKSRPQFFISIKFVTKFSLSVCLCLCLSLYLCLCFSVSLSLSLSPPPPLCIPVCLSLFAYLAASFVFHAYQHLHHHRRHYYYYYCYYHRRRHHHHHRYCCYHLPPPIQCYYNH